MTADDRTPDTREVRSMYEAGSNLYRETPEQHYLGHPAPDYGAEFDRWLARVRQAAKAEALDEFAAWAESLNDKHPRFKAANDLAADMAMRFKADNYETGDSDDRR